MRTIEAVKHRALVILPFLVAACGGVEDLASTEAAATAGGVIPNPNLRFPAPPNTTLYRKRWDAPIRWSIENICYPNRYANVDPIVAFGVPGFGHEHEFLANEIVSHDTTIDDLIRSQSVSCTYIADQSAYWFPSVLVNGRRVDADHAKIYYKAAVTPERIQNIPTGLRMIAGDATLQSTPPANVGFWYEHGNYDNNNTRGRNTMITAGSGRLGLQIYFPDCWNGRDLDSADHKSHMAYSVGRFGSRTCPASHPVALPQLSANVIYFTRAGRTMQLSSGKWTSLHGDYINAWNPDTLQGAIDACLKTRQNCRTHQTGDLAQRHAVVVRGSARLPYMPQGGNTAPPPGPTPTVDANGWYTPASGGNPCNVHWNRIPNRCQPVPAH